MPKTTEPTEPVHDVVIVVPTVACSSVLLPTLARLIADAEDADREGISVGIVLSFNSPDSEGELNRVKTECLRMANEAEQPLLIVNQSGPIGFSAANNRGLARAVGAWGMPELTIFHNDDAHVPLGFAARMLAALRTTTVNGYSEPWSAQSGLRPDRDVAQYGRIGLVGPLSNLVAGIQQVTQVDHRNGAITNYSGDVDRFDLSVQDRWPNQRVTADFLSGFCVGIGREAMLDLMLVSDGIGGLVAGGDRSMLDPRSLWKEFGGTETLEHDEEGVLVGPWDEVSYPIAGYEDNDICVRAELAGWRCIVASDLFVGHIGHQTFDRLFPDALRGMRNRVAYYQRWEGLTRPSTLHVGACYRTRFEVCHDLHLFRLSLQRASQLVDSIAVVLTANPLDVRDHLDYESEVRMLPEEDRAFLDACAGQGAEGVAAALRSWICLVLGGVIGSRMAERLDSSLSVEVWTGTFDERAERNRSIEMAEAHGSDWVVSIDSDEVIENRIRREQIERWIRHPDPLVRSLDQSWINHWDSERLVRLDRPWGDDGSYEGGMHGFRLWRVSRAAPRRIMAGTSTGLHCGNSPDHDASAKRVSGLRFRHFGYLRYVDRKRKHARYREQDPTPDPMLTGNASGDAYGHILSEDPMKMSPFFPLNGIGLTMLVHKGESANDLARALDYLHGITDEIVLVWTDPWFEMDQNADLLPATERIAARVRAREELIEKWSLWVEANPDATPPRKPIPLRSLRCSNPEARIERKSGPGVDVLEVARAFGCSWVHQPLNDDLASARNAGLEALTAADQGTIGWSLFLDLDEVWSEPYAVAVAIRRMAEAGDLHAWMFKFVNLHRDNSASASESFRMARLLPAMRLHGRIHETYDGALVELRNSGVQVAVRTAPFETIHLGLNKDDEGMDRKLERYQRMLQLELMDNPHNSQAWVALGLHYFNERREAKGVACYERAVLCGGDGYLALREMAMYHLRKAKPLLQEAMSRSRGHGWHRANVGLLKYLSEQVPDLPILGSARHGRAVLPDAPLPDFPLPESPAGFGLDEAGGLRRR